MRSNSFGRKLIRKINTPTKPRSLKFYQKITVQKLIINKHQRMQSGSQPTSMN